MIWPITVMYAISLFATIYYLYQQKQTQYMTLKIITSFLFLMLGAISFAETKNPIYLAMLPAYIFCFFGDILLAYAHEIDNKLIKPYFTLGVAAFAIAHIAYCIEFARLLNFRIGLIWGISILMMAIIYATTKSRLFEYGTNRRPSVIYAFLVGLMCGMGIDLMLTFGFDGIYKYLGIGALLFMISDGLLSMKYFKKEVPKAFGFWVLITYYGAMYLLSVAIIA